MHDRVHSFFIYLFFACHRALRFRRFKTVT